MILAITSAWPEFVVAALLATIILVGLIYYALNVRKRHKKRDAYRAYRLLAHTFEGNRYACTSCGARRTVPLGGDRLTFCSGCGNKDGDPEVPDANHSD